MDYSQKTRDELIALCKERNMKGYSGKKKDEILSLLQGSTPLVPVSEKICRLNYIGSKFQLLDWITEAIKEKTGWTSFQDKTVADLFTGTGIVSYHFRKLGATTISNDAELYSSVIAHAFTRSVLTPACTEFVHAIQAEIDSNKHVSQSGFITAHYSPFEGCERMFFTVDNAKRIDYTRARLASIRATLSADEYAFLLASILISADAVSNVPAVYGCFLKAFKAKATKPFTLVPVHAMTTLPSTGSATYNLDVLSDECIESVNADVVYLDPPYNERQYSKNYFPLNIIAKEPSELVSEEPLRGKTGIPSDCFLSPFCKKGDVQDAFRRLFGTLKTRWIFLSYNSESMVSKDAMLDLMKAYGEVSVIERDYKRFKSFEYNADTDIKEYLFCLRKK